MGGEDQHRPPALETWDAIAGYLGVSKRTAQNYERSQKLPVYRLDGDKARVWAYAAELDSWKERFRQTLLKASFDGGPSAEIDGQGPVVANDLQASIEPLVNPVPPPLSVDQATPIRPLVLNEEVARRRWLRYAVTAAGLGVGVAAVMLMPKLRHREPRPNSYRVEGATLIVCGPDSAELWRHTFPKQLYQEAYDALVYREQAFADLNGDGRVEMLFPVVPLEDIPWHTLVCFSSEGKLRWTFQPGKEVIDNLGRSFSEPFFIARYVVFGVPRTAGSQVVVSSVHNWSSACQIAVLDGKSGKLISDYWHRGHITDVMIQSDGDEHPRILIAGVNDAPEYKCATLVVFDHRRVSGAACDPQGQPYFRGMDRGTEISTVYFPKTPVGMKQEFNLAAHLTAAGGRIRLTVHEGIFLTDPYVLYELDYNLQPISAVLSGELIAEYKKLQAAGELPVESPYVTAERLMQQIKVVKGS